MNQPQKKPKYLIITEKWVTKGVLLWSALSVVVGVTAIGIVEGIAIPLMTIVMLFVGKLMINFLLTVQKSNPFISRKIFDYLILFFWGGGIYAFLSFLLYGAFGELEKPQYAFFYIAASIFPLGSSIGAAEKWAQRFNYE